MTKLEKIIRFILVHPKKKCDQQSAYLNWVAYRILNIRYNKYLKKIPVYKSMGEQSNKVWWCWFQGEQEAPELNKACLKSLRDNLTDREIIVITLDNYKEYVNIPDYIIEKFNRKKITYTHFSDILRTELLVKYGGTWIDSSVYCTKYNKDFFDIPLFMFSSFMNNDSSIYSSSWFITSEKNNPILLTVRDLLHKYWKDNNYLLHYYLFHFFISMSINKYKDLWKKVPRFSNIPPHILQFELLDKYNEKRFDQIKEMSDFHKLNQKLDFSNSKDSFYEKIIQDYRGEKK